MYIYMYIYIWLQSPSKYPSFKKKMYKICSAGSEHHVAPIFNHPL